MRPVSYGERAANRPIEEAPAFGAEEGRLRRLGHCEDLLSSERHVVNFARVLLHRRDEFVIVAFAHRLATITSDLLVWHREPPIEQVQCLTQKRGG